MKEEREMNELSAQRIVDEIFMAYLHTKLNNEAVHPGELDGLRSALPTHLRPWFDANVQLRQAGRTLIPVRLSVRPYVDLTAMSCSKS